MKTHLARGLSGTLADIVGHLARGGVVRTINYHNTPLSRAREYERQLAALAGRYDPVSERDLEGWLDTGAWHKARPGLIPVFYEGYRSNYEVGAPLAERYGFRAWFFVPSAFPDVPPAEQRAFAAEHHIRFVEDGGERIAMTWDELRDLDERGHVITSHTRHHVPLAPGTPDELYRREIVGSQRDFERELGHPVKAFAWLYGSEYGADPRADAWLREAGYRFLFSNFKIQRVG